ncbi:MAG TPA: SpoVR family protein [Gammaproteobacteria bacterium]|jgi:stage V sporulation protein R|nr:SpoVR family protein [Gammaproteobacteria bacterium]
MNAALQGYAARLEALAREHGLDYYPVQFEEVPSSFMMEIAVYGLPVRMPHWSFGLRYIHQLVQHRMGHSRLFEVVFPGNPGRAYLAGNNSLQENTLVTAHVLGHADFSRNNALFKRSQEQVGYRIVEQAATHAREIGTAIEQHGQTRVEQILDAALALEAHIDPFRSLRRPRYPEYVEPPRAPHADGFRKRFENLPGAPAAAQAPLERERADLPAAPERDLLWLIAEYAPELEEWERDIFRAVREESFYFYPVFACQIMNEGWASYWHARLLREADFLPHNEYLDALKTHSDVVRPHAAEQQAALSINPYHLGFAIWESIVAEHGIERAFQIRAEDDDFSFVRNHLTQELATELKLFRYERSHDGSIRVLDPDIHALRETLLAPKYNFGVPAVLATHIAQDGSLTLEHEHATDGRGLDLVRAERVLDYLREVWRRPVQLTTVDAAGQPKTLSRAAA